MHGPSTIQKEALVSLYTEIQKSSLSYFTELQVTNNLEKKYPHIAPTYATALIPELVAGRLVFESSQSFSIFT